jgi:hypothetical protein
MTDDSRAQGGLICIAVVVLGALFVVGLLQKSYWALALPVAVLTLFGLGLAFWVGWTIATVQMEPEADPEPAAGEPVAGEPTASESAAPEEPA